MDAKLAAQREDELMAYCATLKEGWERNAIRRDGVEEGLSQGISQGILLTATNMLRDGVDVGLIQKYTGLSLEAIQALAPTPGKGITS